MDHLLALKCIICGARYAVGAVEYVCPKYGDDGILDVIYDYFNEPDQQWLARMSAAEASAYQDEGNTSWAASGLRSRLSWPSLRPTPPARLSSPTHPTSPVPWTVKRAPGSVYSRALPGL
jgi:hypothetical protein